MTNRTWVGGNDGNNVLSADNWNPAGVPQAGDILTVVSGTLTIAKTDLAGNTLNLQDSAEGGGPVELDLNGHARISVAGSLFFGDQLKIDATGPNRVDASVGAISGTINLADNAHLVVTGSMQFVYTDFLNGPADSVLVNNGLIQTENGDVSVPVRGTGTLGFSGYHDGPGVSSINAAISSGQTIDLNPAVSGMTMTLNDPASFHGTLDIVEPPFQSEGDVGVVLQGVVARSFKIKGDHILLKNGHHTVDTIRVADLGSLSVSASFNPTSTRLDFVPASTSS